MRSRQLALGAAMVASAALAAPSPARGASDTVVQLEYRASEQSGCIGEGELRRMVIEQLGHDPFGPDADRRVTITLSRTETGFQGRIAWTDVHGRALGDRFLSSRSRDCREIAANVAFAVTLQLQLIEHAAPNRAAAGAATAAQPPPLDDRSRRARTSGDGPSTPPAPPARPLAAVATPGPPPAEAPPKPPPVESPAPSPPAPPPSPDPARSVRLIVGLGPAVGVGLTPSPAAFGRLFVAARFRRFSVEIAGDSALATTLTERDGSAAVLTPVGASAAGCAHVSAASACLLGRLGWLRARGTGVDLPATSWGQFGQVGLRLAVSRELGRFMVGLHADGLMMVSRWNVVLNETVVWPVRRIGGLVALDVALHFF